MAQKKALIPGATGIVGRPPKDAGTTANVEFLSVDLTDTESCRRALDPISGITHILYMARHDFGAHAPEPIELNALYQCTNTMHLAKAITWMACEPGCANQAFNVINGDYVRWRDLWPVFAEHFAMEAGPVRTVKLAETMPDKSPMWDRIVEKNGLRRQAYEDVALWVYGDHLFTPHWDMMSSMDKARRYGFTDAPDTLTSFLLAFKQLRNDRVVP